MCSGLSCLLPYKSIFQKQLGLSEAQNGMIMAAEKVFSLVAPSLLGTIADRFSIHKSAMIICAVLCAFVSLPLYFIPPVSNPSYNQSCLEPAVNEAEVQCHPINSSCSNCSNCLISCKQTEVYDSTFFLVLFVSILLVFASIPLSSLIDATTMYVLGKNRLYLYGRQRLWGAVGFAAVGLLAGFLVDIYSNAVHSKEKDYLLAFVCLALFQLITAIVVVSLDVPKHSLSSFLHKFGSLVRNKHISLLLFVVFISGFNLGARFAFTFWYVEHLPGSNPTLLGLSVFVGCFVEIPMFFVSGWIITKLGCQFILALGLLASALQCYLYTIITVAWPLILIESLHGISFALPMAAMCTHAAVLSPEGFTAAVIGLTQGMYWGLGNMAGALVSGIIYKSFGALKMFRINSIIAVCGAVLYYVLVIIMARCEKTKSADDEEIKSKESAEA